MIEVKVVKYETIDKEQFDNEIDAKKHEAVLRLTGPLEDYLKEIESPRTRATAERIIKDFAQYEAEWDERHTVQEENLEAEE